MKKEIIEFLGNLTLGALSLLYASFSSGFVVYKFWHWFLLPVFTTAPNVNFWQAVGLSVFIGLFKSIDTSDKYLNGVKIKKKVDWGTSIILPWVLVFVGLLIKLVIS